MNMKWLIAGITTFLIAIVCLTGALPTTPVTIQGNEVAVLQDMRTGVRDEVWTSGTKFYANWFLDVYKYDIGTQKASFGNIAGQQGEYEPIPVEIGENGGQTARIVMSVNYRLDPSKIVELHKKGLAKSYETMILNREIIDTVNEVARPMKSALDIYSGVGFVEFKKEVDLRLRNNTELTSRGILVENTIIAGVQLDPKYKEQIDLKIVAIQSKLRAQEEALAAVEESKKVKAQMQSEVERRTQEANAKKAEVELAAQAKGAELKAIAEGQRDANIAKATGDLALGRAEAEVAQLKSSALYAGEAGGRRAEVEIATKRAEMMKNIVDKVSILPERTFAQIGKSGGVLVNAEGN